MKTIIVSTRLTKRTNQRGLSHMRIVLRAVFGALALAGTVVAGAMPAQAAVTLSVGHVDAINPVWVNNQLDLKVNDETGSTPVTRDPADVIFRALPASRKTVPTDPRFAFLGSPGDPVWILPQTQNASLLWPGWSTEDLPTGVFTGNTVQIRLVSISRPTGGQVALYSTGSTGAPTVIFDTENGLPDSAASAIPQHRHMNWAFEATGTYRLGFEVTATRNGATITSGVHTYTFTVG
jgi:surface-anchored protein